MLATYELPQYILGYYTKNKITPLKLQKLLYYVKVWGIVAGVELYQGKFEKWPHGPVNPDVYHQYKSFGRNPIVESFNGYPDFGGLEQELTDFIIEAYLPFSAISLSAMTHKELPVKAKPPRVTVSEKSLPS